MARVRFTDDYDYKPTVQSTIAYKAGMEMTVRQECAAAAVAAGKAVLLDKPKRAAPAKRPVKAKTAVPTTSTPETESDAGRG